MLKKVIRNLFFPSIEDGYKEEFKTEMFKINIYRGNITAVMFIVLELLSLLLSIAIKKQKIYKYPNICYLISYIAMIIVMFFFLSLFKFLSKKDTYKKSTMSTVNLTFPGFILLWSICISLIDQLSSGQVIVYTVTAMAISIAPILEPIDIFIIYFIGQVIFIICLPLFQKSQHLLFGNYLNASTFSIVFFVISRMLYTSKINDFRNKKIIKENNIKLNDINMKLLAANGKLEKLAETDSLTKIFNRRKCDEVLYQEWSNCKKLSIPLTVIMIDLDHFKIINDTYGHQAGDYVLKEVSKVIKDNLRNSDFVGRFGGEEFLIILPNTKIQIGYEIAESIRSKISNLKLAYSGMRVTISAGAKELSKNINSEIELLKAADTALYRAKEKGRNRVEIMQKERLEL